MDVPGLYDGPRKSLSRTLGVRYRRWEASERKKVSSHCQVVSYLLATYATNNDIAETEAEIANFKNMGFLNVFMKEHVWDRSLWKVCTGQLNFQWETIARQIRKSRSKVSHKMWRLWSSWKKGALAQAPQAELAGMTSVSRKRRYGDVNIVRSWVYRSTEILNPLGLPQRSSPFWDLRSLNRRKNHKPTKACKNAAIV